MNLSELKVLVADDMAGMRRYVGAKLFEIGIQDIQYATGGEEGKEAVQNGSFDLVLSDINMPGGSGLDFLKWVRSSTEFRDLKFIIITSEVDIKTMNEAIRLGVDEYIVKPFEKVQLEDKIEKAFSSSQNSGLSFESMMDISIKHILETISSQCKVPLQEADSQIITTQIRPPQGKCYFAMSDCKTDSSQFGVMLHFDESSFHNFVSAMFNGNVDIEDDGVEDTVAEFLNMGLAKVRGEMMQNMHGELHVSIPTGLCGQEMAVGATNESPIHVVEVKSPIGSFELMFQDGGNQVLPWKCSA